MIMSFRGFYGSLYLSTNVKAVRGRWVIIFLMSIYGRGVYSLRPIFEALFSALTRFIFMPVRLLPVCMQAVF